MSALARVWQLCRGSVPTSTEPGAQCLHGACLPRKLYASRWPLQAAGLRVGLRGGPHRGWGSWAENTLGLWVPNHLSTPCRLPQMLCVPAVSQAGSPRSESPGALAQDWGGLRPETWGLGADVLQMPPTTTSVLAVQLPASPLLWLLGVLHGNLLYPPCSPAVHRLCLQWLLLEPGWVRGCCRQ